eukprot:TRINITY_DN111117_c0_g1_i1.p1 TRINITY_DN111117_c0_g1~~TRINITY_DN111117_c0_g1_i1.p1  ORF type:complete len:412 (-),score=78.59 TRINITY_DN111117_c0_g1_i1:24-1259(-)
MKVVRTTYRHEQEDGSVQLTTTLRCPCEGCGAELDDFPGLAAHALEAHGLQLATSVPSAASQSDPSRAKQKVSRLRLSNGEVRLVCPVCCEQLPEDEAAFLDHMAAVHGKALAAPGRLGGESEQLDMLHQSSAEHWHPRRQDVLQKLRVISLGSFCGMKFSIQRLGLGDAHLPFDWIRTTSSGVAHFVQTGFEDFFSVASAYDVPSAGFKVHRAERHSFWHDDVSQADVRQKMRRRVARFLDLAEDPPEEVRDLLFVRSCACTEELRQVEDLYAALQERFASPMRTRRILLAIIVDGQARREGPIFHAKLPGLLLLTQPLSSHEAAMRGEGYCWAVAAACDAALGEGPHADGGFSAPSCELTIRWVQSGSELLEGGDHTPVAFCDAGLQSGYGDLACFEPPGATHVNLERA